jgi:heavy metal sensor kinase
MKFNSITFEISILYTAILGLILVVFSGILYFISDTFLRQVDQQLTVKAQAVDADIRSHLDKDHNSLYQAVTKALGANTGNIYVNFTSRDAKKVFSSPNMSHNLRLLFLQDIQFPPGRMSFRTLDAENQNIRIINEVFTDPNLSSQYLIQVGLGQDPLMQQMRNWVYSMAISVPLILALTSFVGRLLANRILVRVYTIIDKAKQITQEDLSGRINLKHFDREMASLGASFNEMIARLEKSFKHIEQFSYHVAHELKTPLTIIQGEAELLLRKERTTEEYKQALKIVTEESQRVLKTVDDLLLLTKLDYQSEVFKFEQFDFLEFFTEIVEQNRLTAANKGIGIRMGLPQARPAVMMVKGDRLHLRRLFFNIIANAIEFTPEGGCIDMHVEESQGKIVTVISDTGPGIAPEHLEKIFEKFYQVDTNAAGSGLGLHIANTIAKLHQGQVLVQSRLGHGSTFRVILPLQV